MNNKSFRKKYQTPFWLKISFLTAVLFIFEKYGCRYHILVKSQNRHSSWKLSYYNKHFDSKTMEICSKVESGKCSKGRDVSNDAQPQPLVRSKQTLYQQLQVSALLCILNSKFENVAPEKPGVQIKSFRVHF